MTPIPTELRELMEQICVELEHDNDRYMLGRELRKALATPPADAADMGGLAGEEVEVVGYWTEDGLHWTEESAAHGSKAYQSMMTVAQHRRINAQHRQQAGKLVEALRACRSELHAMITAHNVQSEHDGSWLYDYQTVYHPARSHTGRDGGG